MSRWMGGPQTETAPPQQSVKASGIGEESYFEWLTRVKAEQATKAQASTSTMQVTTDPGWMQGAAYPASQPTQQYQSTPYTTPAQPQHSTSNRFQQLLQTKMARERASGMPTAPTPTQYSHPTEAFAVTREEYDRLRNGETVFNTAFARAHCHEQASAPTVDTKPSHWSMDLNPSASSSSRLPPNITQQQSSHTGPGESQSAALTEHFRDLVAGRMRGMYASATGSSSSHQPQHPHSQQNPPDTNVQYPQLIRARFGMEFEFAPSAAPPRSTPMDQLAGPTYPFGADQHAQWKIATPEMPFTTQQQQWEAPPPPYWPNQPDADMSRPSGSSVPPPGWQNASETPPWNLGLNGIIHRSLPSDSAAQPTQSTFAAALHPHNSGAPPRSVDTNMPKSLVEYGLNSFMSMNGSIQLPNVGPQVAQSTGEQGNGDPYPNFSGLGGDIGGDSYGSGDGGDFHPNGGTNGNGDASGSGGPGGDGDDGDGPGESGEADVPRKKKLALACHFCRRRKLKCDGIRPTCENCSRRGEVCTYDDNVRRRGPGKRTKELRERGSIKDASALLQDDSFDPHSIEGISGALTDGGTPGDVNGEFDTTAFQNADGTFDPSAFQHHHPPIDPSLLDPGDDYPTDDATAAAVAAAVAEHAERNANARAINELQMHLQAYPELTAGVDLDVPDEGDGSEEPLTLAELGENMAAASSLASAGTKREREAEGDLEFDLTGEGEAKRLKAEEGIEGDA